MYKGECKISGCKNEIRIIRLQMCRVHSTRFYTYGNPNVEKGSNRKRAGKKCIDCVKPVFSREMCKVHYHRWYYQTKRRKK